MNVYRRWSRRFRSPNRDRRVIRKRGCVPAVEALEGRFCPSLVVPAFSSLPASEFPSCSQQFRASVPLLWQEESEAQHW